MLPQLANPHCSEMRAARIHAYGPPGVIALEDLDATQPGPGQVLVRVAAAGVGQALLENAFIVFVDIVRK